MLIQLACIHTYNDNTVTGCWYVCGGVVRVAPLSEAYLFIIHTLANQGCQQAVLPCIVPAAPPVIQEMVLLDSGLKMARESNRYHALGKPLYYLFSRAVDLAVAVPLLLALSPVFLLIALLIKLDSPGPAIFVQTRVGLSLIRPFSCRHVWGAARVYPATSVSAGRVRLSSTSFAPCTNT